MTAQKCAEEAMALTEKMGLATLAAAATTNHGAALIAQGRYEEGIAEMRRGAIRASGGDTVPRVALPSCLRSWKDRTASGRTPGAG
jgi:hypothetical protein